MYKLWGARSVLSRVWHVGVGCVCCGLLLLQGMAGKGCLVSEGCGVSSTGSVRS